MKDRPVLRTNRHLEPLRSTDYNESAVIDADQIHFRKVLGKYECKAPERVLQARCTQHNCAARAIRKHLVLALVRGELDDSGDGTRACFRGCHKALRNTRRLWVDAD